MTFTMPEVITTAVELLSLIHRITSTSAQACLLPITSPSALLSEGFRQTNIQTNTDITTTHSSPPASPKPKVELMSDSELFGYNREAFENVESNGRDENTVTETDRGLAAVGWDIDETLVEEQITGSLEKQRRRLVIGFIAKSQPGN